jgi:hypothetical protein
MANRRLWHAPSRHASLRCKRSTETLSHACCCGSAPDAHAAGNPARQLCAESDTRVAGVKVLLHSSTPEWCGWRERHVQCLPELQAHTVQLEQKRREAGAAERWIQGNYLRYLQACPL